MAKKIIWSDEWGEIIEYHRWRDQKGRYLKDKSRARFKRHETIQYRVVNGKRSGEPIFLRRPGKVLKTTGPELMSRKSGSIYEMLRETNVLSEAHRATSALINLRGVDKNGDIWRHQFNYEIGEGKESEQLVNAIYWELASYGLRTNYNIDLVTFRHTSKSDARSREALEDLQIVVTLKS